MDYFLRHSTRTMQKKMPRKALRLLKIPNNIVTSILLVVVCASSEKCARRMMKKQLAVGVHKIDLKKNSMSTTSTVSVSNGKHVFFFQLWGYRRTPPASSCPLEHGSTWCIRSRHDTSWSCPPPSGLAVDWVYVEIRRLSSHQPTVVWPRREATFCGMIITSNCLFYVLGRKSAHAMW